MRFMSRRAGWPCDLGIRSQCDGCNASLEAAVRHPAGVCPEVGVGCAICWWLCCWCHTSQQLRMPRAACCAHFCDSMVLKGGRNWEESQAARAPLSSLDSVSDGGVQVEDSCEGSAFPLTANLSVTLI